MSATHVEPSPVVLLHGSANTGALWRRIGEALAPGCRAITPDLIGYGRAPAWRDGAAFGIADEVRAIEAALPDGGEPFDLLGYSYGGAVAIALTVSEPARVRSLTLIEPVFPLALAYHGERPAYETLCRLRDTFIAMTTSGRRDDAMQRFVDFWTGDGAWAGMPDTARAGMTTCADKIVLDFRAVFTNDPGTERLAALAMPIALLRGDRSPEPMRRLVDALHALMPGSSHHVVAGAGHLLPVTHPAAVVDVLRTQVERSS